MKIAVAKGDGIGPEIMEAVLKIFEANKDLIKNPDLIQVGWKLKIPQA